MVLVNQPLRLAAVGWRLKTEVALVGWLLWWATIGGCPSAPSETPNRVWLDLDDAWSPAIWERQVDESGIPIKGEEHATITAHLELSSDLVGVGSALVLEGLSASALVEVNGRELPEAIGGPGPVEVPVGTLLRPGRNKVVVHVSGRGEAHPLLSGTVGVAATLEGAPALQIRPRQHVRRAVATLEDSGLVLRAWTHAAPVGAQVHFDAWLDGEQLQDWGPTPVQDDRALLEAAAWNRVPWDMKQAPGQLFHLRTRLLDRRGKLLDQFTQRTGVRRFGLEDKEAKLNGERVQLVGVRRLEGSLSRTLGILGPAGLNLVEYHGTFPSRSDRAMADEVGVALAVMPRCDGRIRAEIKDLESHGDVLKIQNERMIAAAGNTPSLLVWATEGAADLASQKGVGKMLVEGMRYDPVSRLVTAWDLPYFSLSARVDAAGELVGPSLAGLSDQAWWILELFYVAGEENTPAEMTAHTLQACLDKGAIGGVLPGVPTTDEDWVVTWAERSSALGISPLASEGRRAGARVRVEGLVPGEVAMLELPGGARIGGVADADGVVTLEGWHAGPAQLRVGKDVRSVDLVPGAWRDFTWSGKVTEVGWTR